MQYYFATLNLVFSCEKLLFTPVILTIWNLILLVCTSTNSNLLICLSVHLVKILNKGNANITAFTEIHKCHLTHEDFNVSMYKFWNHDLAECLQILILTTSMYKQMSSWEIILTANSSKENILLIFKVNDTGSSASIVQVTVSVSTEDERAESLWAAPFGDVSWLECVFFLVSSLLWPTDTYCRFQMSLTTE